MKEKLKKYKIQIISSVIISVLILGTIICVIYKNNFYNAYEEAKMLSNIGKYKEAYLRISKFPIFLGDEKVKNNISIIKLKGELGYYIQNAKSSKKSIDIEYVKDETNLLFWTSAISDLYRGLETSIKYNPTNEEEKSIKTEFITLYYYNLYSNLPRRYLEEKFINELNDMEYNKREKKIEEIATEQIGKLEFINELAILEPIKGFEEKLFDYNYEFHYPKIEYRDKYNKIIKSDYLTNVYRQK